MKHARALLAGAALSGACSTTTSFVVENAPADTVLDVGTAPAVVVSSRAIPIEIAPGAEPVAWKLRDTRGGVVDEGLIERTEVQWPVVATGLGVAACCVPCGAAFGFCIANPALLTAPISFLAAGNAGVVVTTLASPSWATGPLTAAGAAVGATPLLLGLTAQAPPAHVTITLAAPTVTAPTSSVSPADEPALSGSSCTQRAPCAAPAQTCVDDACSAQPALANDAHRMPF